jgi:hypothetical protein
MAKRRTVPLFDLLTRPDPTAGVQGGSMNGPQGSDARAAGDAAGLASGGESAAQGMPIARVAGVPKPVVRLAVPPQGSVGKPGTATEVAPAAEVEAKPVAARAEPAHRFVGSTSTIQAVPPPATVAAAEAAETWAGRDLQVPRLGLWILVFVVICGALAVWGVAYKLGFTSGKKSTEDLVRRDPPAVVEPGVDGGAATGRGSTQKPGSGTGLGNLGMVSPEPLARPQAAPATPAPRQAPTGSGSIVLPDLPSPETFDAVTPDSPFLVGANVVSGPNSGQPGWATADPRVVGLNYLLLGKMARRDAGEAVVFLSANGEYVFATPVENKRQGSKDAFPPAEYELWVGPGLSRAEFQADKGDPVKKRVETLGRFWSGTAKKRFDFKSTYWVKKD